jgi:hypothetical protein
MRTAKSGLIASALIVVISGCALEYDDGEATDPPMAENLDPDQEAIPEPVAEESDEDSQESLLAIQCWGEPHPGYRGWFGTYCWGEGIWFRARVSCRTSPNSSFTHFYGDDWQYAGAGAASYASCPASAPYYIGGWTNY